MNHRFLYLHGFASGPGSKKAQFFRERFLGVGVDLEIPDLAAGDFERLTLSGQLRLIERLAACEPVHLMGSSLGGYLAALYAARHPEVGRMVLMAPAFGFARRWAASLGPGQMENWRRAGVLPVFHYGEGRERPLGYQFIQDAHNYEDHPAITQPALIFHGRNDTVVPMQAAVEFVACRPSASLQVLNSDHELLDVVDRIWVGAREFFGVR